MVNDYLFSSVIAAVILLTASLKKASGQQQQKAQTIPTLFRSSSAMILLVARPSLPAQFSTSSGRCRVRHKIGDQKIPVHLTTSRNHPDERTYEVIAGQF